MQRKAEKKRLKGKRIQNQAHEPPVATSGSSSNALTVRAQSTSFPTQFAIPRALVESPEQDSIYAFFTDFVLHANHPDAQCELFEYLPPLYNAARHDSIVSLAASTVALAVSGGDPHRRQRFHMGRVMNGMALKKVALAIQDPVQSLQDETLMAVLLLGYFDVGLPLPNRVVLNIFETETGL